MLKKTKRNPISSYQGISQIKAIAPTEEDKAAITSFIELDASLTLLAKFRPTKIVYHQNTGQLHAYKLSIFTTNS